LKARKIEVECLYVREVDPATVKGYDCLIVGSPTQIRTATGPIGEFLQSLTPQDLSGKLAVAFDTRFRSWLAGGATGGIERRLKRLGFRIIAPGLAAYVEGKLPDVRLMDDEVDKARRFAEEIAAALGKPV